VEKNRFTQLAEKCKDIKQAKGIKHHETKALALCLNPVN
jgi:hypothetical protein